MTAPKNKSPVNRLLELAKDTGMFDNNAKGDAYIEDTRKERGRARKILSHLYHDKFGEPVSVGATNRRWTSFRAGR